MARYLRYVFPVANNLNVCALQNTVGAAALVLNGNLANQVTKQVSFIDRGYSRSISLTSVNNLAGVNFTISGIQNGVLLTEVLAGPNANTVYSVQIYDKIYSIATNGGVNQVSVGTGYTGFFPLININLERDNINYILTTSKLTAGSIHTTIFSTVLNISNNGATFLDAIANSFDLFPIKAYAADDQYIFPASPSVAAPSFRPSPPYNSILIYVSGEVGEIANSIGMNFIQI
tara:strand:+ start:895 stop:1590 length:696 start_codon:yes stop_codon:yes gene_type:complete